MPESERRELERYWKQRCQKAKADLDAARANVRSLKPESTSGRDGSYAFARAIRDETTALIKYSRVLRMYTDLMVHAKMPEEAE